MEGNPASSYVSHGINLTVTLLALRAAAVYNQTLETLSSLIFLKTSPEDRGPRRGGTKGRPVAPPAAARSARGFGGSPTKSSIKSRQQARHRAGERTVPESRRARGNRPAGAFTALPIVGPRGGFSGGKRTFETTPPRDKGEEIRASLPGASSLSPTSASQG